MHQIKLYLPAEKGPDTRPFLIAEQGVCDLKAARAIDSSPTYLSDNFCHRPEIKAVVQAVSRRGSSTFVLAGAHRVKTLRFGRWLLFVGGVRAELLEALKFFYDVPFVTAGHDGWNSPTGWNNGTFSMKPMKFEMKTIVGKEDKFIEKVTLNASTSC